MENKSVQPEWFRSWFGDHAYLERYEHRDESEARQAVKSILQKIPLSEKSSVLDCACGTGRYLKYLKKQFPIAVGMDLSYLLLSHGKKENPEINVIQSDMRNMPFRKNSFQCIFSLFTSFGYFEDNTNTQILTSWHDMLMPDGFLIIDTINSAHLHKHLQPESVHASENFTFYETRNITDRRVEKNIIVHPHSSTQAGHTHPSFHESVRLYEYSELDDITRQAGFTPVSVLGNYRGDDFNPSSASHDRMIFILQKSI
jgi:SAM-dependent methyltransferase